MSVQPVVSFLSLLEPKYLRFCSLPPRGRSLDAVDRCRLMSTCCVVGRSCGMNLWCAFAISMICMALDQNTKLFFVRVQSWVFAILLLYIAAGAVFWSVSK